MVHAYWRPVTGAGGRGDGGDAVPGADFNN